MLRSQLCHNQLIINQQFTVSEWIIQSASEVAAERQTQISTRWLSLLFLLIEEWMLKVGIVPVDGMMGTAIKFFYY